MITKNELVKYLELSSAPDQLKGIFFSGFSTSFNPLIVDESINQADLIFITTAIHIDIIKDIIAIKIKAPQKKCYVLSTEPCRNYVLDLCQKYIDKVIVFQSAFELGMVLSMVREGTPVITRHRIPQLVFVTYSFPFKHIYRPYGFLYTTKLRGDWNNYIGNELGVTEAFMIQNSRSVYHLEGEEVGKDILTQFGVKVHNIYPACMDEFFSRKNTPDWDGVRDPHIVYMSSEPHKYIFPYADLLKNQNIHLHVYLPYYYNDPSYLSFQKMKYGLTKMLNETVSNPYFHLHSEYPYTSLVEEISQYDFAFPFFDIPQKSTYTPIASNFFMALEAGLPLIVPRNSLGMMQIVENYQVGLSVDIDHFTSLREILVSSVDVQLKQKVLEVRGSDLKYDSVNFYNLIFGGSDNYNGTQ